MLPRLLSGALLLKPFLLALKRLVQVLCSLVMACSYVASLLTSVMAFLLMVPSRLGSPTFSQTTLDRLRHKLQIRLRALAALIDALGPSSPALHHCCSDSSGEFAALLSCTFFVPSAGKLTHEWSSLDFSRTSFLGLRISFAVPSQVQRHNLPLPCPCGTPDSAS